MHSIKDFKKIIVTIITFCWVYSFSNCFSQAATITVSNINSSIMDNTGLLFGITFDGRSSLTGNASYGQIGYHNANGSMIPEINTIFGDFPFTTIRYPGNAITVGFEWKKSIGPIGTRPNQDLMGGLGSPQPVNFGFDEFMTMCTNKGISGSDIQIMVPIYDQSTIGLTPTQANAAIPNVISNNADWVEYCNSPDDGSNAGGGVDWAAVRATNGHPSPYNVKIWNIGNEPWASGEFGPSATNCNAFLSSVTPIIDAMLAIDPTIKITISTTGNAASNSSWAYALINSSLAQQGKLYGLSQHVFGDEDLATGNPGVNATGSFLDNLVSAAATKNIRVFVGDYAHSIPSSNSTIAQQNLAMQWQGANYETDFLLMLSQKSTIERANFWAYGNAYAVWHPIRINSQSNYTLMPAAVIYKILKPAFLDKSVHISTTSPPSSDGNPYAVRSNAFVSDDLSKMTIVAVNRDKDSTVPLQVSGTFGYNLNNPRLLTASSLSSDTISETNATTDLSGNYAMPPMSVLILEYQLTALPLNLTSLDIKMNDCKTLLSWTTSAEHNLNYYEVQQSTDNTNWNTLSQIPTTGNSSEVSYYSFQNQISAVGYHYFRLKMVDNDQSCRYSKTVSCNCRISDDINTVLFPNPVRMNGILSFSRSLDSIRVFDIYGKLILFKTEPSTFISTAEMLPGLYFIQSENSTLKFIVE
jgi:alpha-L-arabinofuranosidase